MILAGPFKVRYEPPSTIVASATTEIDPIGLVYRFSLVATRREHSSRRARGLKATAKFISPLRVEATFFDWQHQNKAVRNIC
jgi:hypothetical protein